MTENISILDKRQTKGEERENAYWMVDDLLQIKEKQLAKKKNMNTWNLPQNNQDMGCRKRGAYCLIDMQSHHLSLWKDN